MREGLTKFLCNSVTAYLDYALAHFGVTRFRHLPLWVSIEPSNRCQLHCPECPVGNGTGRKSGAILEMDTYKRILSQVAPTVHTIQFYFQGEPLLNPHITEMIRMAHDRGIYTILSTNALGVTELMANNLAQSGLNRIIVSIDGMSEESYQAYRVGGSLHQAMEGLSRLRDAKMAHHSRMHIELQCLMLRTNEQDWPLLRRSYRKMGADSLTLKTAQLYDYQHGHPLMPTDSRFSRYQPGRDGLYHLKRGRLSRLCRRLYFGAVIDVEGNMLPCCFDKSARYSYGNILHSDLPSVWQSEAAISFRKKVWNTKKSVNICQNCSE